MCLIDPEVADPLCPNGSVEEEGKCISTDSESCTIDDLNYKLRLTQGNSNLVIVPFNISQVDTPVTERFYVNMTYGYKLNSNPITITIIPLI